MADPYETKFRNSAGDGSVITSRQELITYEWRNDTLFKITTIRKFFMGGSDYIDTQTVTPVYQE